MVTFYFGDLFLSSDKIIGRGFEQFYCHFLLSQKSWHWLTQ